LINLKKVTVVVKLVGQNFMALALSNPLLKIFALNFFAATQVSELSEVKSVVLSGFSLLTKRFRA
jgi:hypothetical protein